MKNKKDRNWNFETFLYSNRNTFNVLPMFRVYADGDLFTVTLGWLFWEVRFGLEDLNSIPF